MWRRFTGGGTVYLDPGVVCAALVLPASHPAAAAGVPDMYSPFLDGMVRPAAQLGVDAERDERTVRVDGRKVTGIAAHRNRGGDARARNAAGRRRPRRAARCIAGPRGGELEGTPRPSPSRPDQRRQHRRARRSRPRRRLSRRSRFAAPVVTEPVDAHVAALAPPSCSRTAMAIATGTPGRGRRSRRPPVAALLGGR